MQINLLLNRASPWLDIDSYLPYEGKVLIKIKSTRSVSVRIPRWAHMKSVRSDVYGRTVEPGNVGRYLLFDRLRAGDVVTVEFPVVESSATYTLGWSGMRIPGWTEVTRPLLQEEPSSSFDYYVSANGTVKAPLPAFTMRFRGNEVVDISPREDGLGYPLYQREHYAQGEAPLKRVERFVAVKLIDL